MSTVLIAAAETPWLGVDWGALATVFIVSLIATVVVVGSFALATRMLAVGAPDIRMAPGADPDGPDAVASVRVTRRPFPATIGAGALFAVGIAATLYGIYLVIPLFHR